MGLKSGISLTFFSPSLQKQPPEMLCKKGALRSFAKFTGRHRGSHQRWSVRKGVLRNFAKCIGKLLCQIHFLLKLQASDCRPSFFLCLIYYIIRPVLILSESHWKLLSMFTNRQKPHPLFISKASFYHYRSSIIVSTEK